MTDDEKLAAKEYGITHEAKTVFHFRGHRYDRLEDAIAYAKAVARRSKSAQTTPAHVEGSTDVR